MTVQKQLAEYLSVWKETDALYRRLARLSGISDNAFWILYCLWQFGENLTQKNIREQWSVSKQTVHSALKELEKKRIIRVSESDGDKRSKQISLTEEGCRFAEKYLGAVCKADENAFSKMSGSEREAMLNCAKRYLELFQSEAEKIFAQKGGF